MLVVAKGYSNDYHPWTHHLQDSTFREKSIKPKHQGIGHGPAPMDPVLYQGVTFCVHALATCIKIHDSKTQIYEAYIS